MGICFGVSLISSNSTSSSSTAHLSSPSTVQMGNSSNVSQIIATNTSPSSGSSSSSTPQHETSLSSTTCKKVIDMATATNVFDFLLCNHNELLPGDINFLSASGNAAGVVPPLTPVQTNISHAISGGGGGGSTAGGGGAGSTTLNSRHTFYHSSAKQPSAMFAGDLAGSSNNIYHARHPNSSQDRENIQSNRY